MRIVVTGAGGKLASCVTDTLVAAGHDVVALDVAQYRPLPIDLRVVDLRDSRAVAGEIAGADAIVHAGNIPNPYTFPGLQVLHDNLRMNVNVVEAALDAGVKKLIFTSTIQVVSGLVSRDRGGPNAHRVAYLPLDAQSPPNPVNQYSIGKRMTEVMLETYAAPNGLDAIVLRLPGLRRGAEESPQSLGYWNPAWRAAWRKAWSAKHKHWHREPWNSPSERADAFTQLTTEDASSLMLRLLEMDTPGYRLYMPGICRVPAAQVPAVIRRFYADVPLRKPIDEMTTLVDCSDITDETGWRPEHALRPIEIPEDVLAGDG